MTPNETIPVLDFIHIDLAELFVLLSQVTRVFLELPAATAPLTLGMHGTQEGTQLVLLHTH